MKRNLADEPVTEAGRSLLASVTVTARNESQLTNWRLAIRAIEAEAAADAIRERDEARAKVAVLNSDATRLSRYIAARGNRHRPDCECDCLWHGLMGWVDPAEPKAGAIVTVGKP